MQASASPYQLAESLPAGRAGWWWVGETAAGVAGGECGRVAGIEKGPKERTQELSSLPYRRPARTRLRCLHVVEPPSRLLLFTERLEVLLHRVLPALGGRRTKGAGRATGSASRLPRCGSQ